MVPLVWSALTVGEAVATGADGGQTGTDAGTDGGAPAPRDNLCSVAGAHGGFGKVLGAGCC